MLSRRLTLAFILGLLAGAAGLAQQPTRPSPPPSGPRMIVGVVTDTLGNVVDSADVVVGQLKRHALTKSDGTFRFDDIKPGTYELSVRKLGFFPQVRRVKSVIQAARSCSSSFAPRMCCRES